MATLTHKQKTYDRGIKAEILAAIWLWLKGYKILERRYKTAVGEIDLVVRKGNVIAFVEVKARETKEKALESITRQMRSRIERTASYYISQNKVSECDFRFDLITIIPPFKIHHLDNAWYQRA